MEIFQNCDPDSDSFSDVYVLNFSRFQTVSRMDRLFRTTPPRDVVSMANFWLNTLKPNRNELGLLSEKIKLGSAAPMILFIKIDGKNTTNENTLLRRRN